MVDRQREPEYEEVRLQRGDAEARQRRPRDRDADHVGGRRRHLHPEDEAGERRQEQRRPDLAARPRDDRGRELDAQTGDAEHADHDGGAQDDGADHRDLPPGRQHRLASAGEALTRRDAAVTVDEEREDADQDGEARRVLRRVAEAEHGAEQRAERHQEERRGDEHVAPLRPLVVRQPGEAESCGEGVDADPHGEEVEDRRQQRGDDDLGIGNARQLDHDERAGAHQRRHDLPAGGRDRLDRAGEPLGVAETRHRRQRDRPGGGDVGRGRTGDRSEQRRREHRDLRRAAPQPSRRGGRDVHEPLARLARVQHGAEDHEDGYDSHRDAGQAAPKSAFGDRQRAEEAGHRGAGVAELAGDVLPVKAVEKRQQRHQRERPADHPPRPFHGDEQQAGCQHQLRAPLQIAVLFGERGVVPRDPDAARRCRRRRSPRR